VGSRQSSRQRQDFSIFRKYSNPRPPQRDGHSIFSELRKDSADSFPHSPSKLKGQSDNIFFKFRKDAADSAYLLQVKETVMLDFSEFREVYVILPSPSRLKRQ
jgi:hypothetical protein